MSYEVRFDSDQVTGRIVRYVQERFDGPAAQNAAIDRIEEAFAELGEDPIGMGSPSKSPLVGMTAILTLDHVSHRAWVKVAYSFSEDEDAIEIIGFAPVDF